MLDAAVFCGGGRAQRRKFPRLAKSDQRLARHNSTFTPHRRLQHLQVNITMPGTVCLAGVSGPEFFHVGRVDVYIH